MSDKDMVTVHERRDGSKPKLWTVYVDLGWIVFFRVLSRGGRHVEESGDGHYLGKRFAVVSRTHRLGVEPLDLGCHRLPRAYRCRFGEGGCQ